MKGPKPKPTALKIIEGKPGHRPLNKNEPAVDGLAGSAPDWMNPEQREIWRNALACAPMGLITKIDESVLTTWVVACYLHQEATEKVNQMGLIVKSPVKGDPMQNPYLPIINRQALIMQKAAAEMGFTPSSRSRVSVPSGGRGAGNKFSNNGRRET